MIIKMRGKKYEIDAKECEYKLSVSSNNVLMFRRKELIFLVIHLDNLCLGSKLDLFNLFKIKIKEVA